MPRGPTRQPPEGYGVDRGTDGRYYPVRITAKTDNGFRSTLVREKFPSGDPSGRPLSFSKRIGAVRYLERVVEAQRQREGATK